MYDIGKAMEDYYAFKGNVYPVDTVRVKINIEKGEYDLNNPNNYDAQGFPTMDYLLYGLDKEMPKVIDHFKNDQKISNYLGKIIDELISTTSTVNSDWKSTKEEFVKSIENSASSNLNMLINDLFTIMKKDLGLINLVFQEVFFRHPHYLIGLKAITVKYILKN